MKKLIYFKIKFTNFIDVKISENQKVIPKLEFGRAIHDLSPDCHKMNLIRIWSFKVQEINFKKLIKNYDQNLLDNLRGFGKDDEYLKFWVPGTNDYQSFWI